MAQEKPADNADDLPADEAEPATKRARRTAAAESEASAALGQRTTKDNAAAGQAPGNEKTFRRLRRASRKTFSADAAAEVQPAAEATAAMTDGEAAAQGANPGRSAEPQEPAASKLQMVSSQVAATAHGDQDAADAEEAQAPAARAERRPQPHKGQPKAAAQEAAGADDLAVKVSADGRLPCHERMCV